MCGATLSLGAPSPAFRSGFAFLLAQHQPGTIKPSLFPLRVRLSVPTLRGSGLILRKTPQKTFSVDAVAGPSVPLDVRPGGGCYLGQGISFASSFGGVSSPAILFWSLSRMDLEAGMQEIQRCCCGVFFNPETPGRSVVWSTCGSWWVLGLGRGFHNSARSVRNRNQPS